MSPSTDVEKKAEGGSVALVGPTLDEIETSLVNGQDLEVRFQDPELAAQAIMLRILSAKTDEEAFTPTGTTSGRDLLGVPLEILANDSDNPLRAFPSQFEGEGPSFFIAFDAIRLDNGEKLTISTSSRNVLAALINGIRRGRFPERTMKFIPAERPTRAGYIPLWLVKADFDKEAA